MCVGAGNYVRVGEWVLGVCEIIKCVCVVCVGGGGGGAGTCMTVNAVCMSR